MHLVQLALVLTGDASSFNRTAFRYSLATALPDVHYADVAILSIEPASVRVTARISSLNATHALTLVRILNAMGPTGLSDALDMIVERYEEAPIVISVSSLSGLQSSNLSTAGEVPSNPSAVSTGFALGLAAGTAVLGLLIGIAVALRLRVGRFRIMRPLQFASSLQPSATDSVAKAGPPTLSSSDLSTAALLPADHTNTTAAEQSSSMMEGKQQSVATSFTATYGEAKALLHGHARKFEQQHGRKPTSRKDWGEVCTIRSMLHYACNSCYVCFSAVAPGPALPGTARAVSIGP